MWKLLLVGTILVGAACVGVPAASAVPRSPSHASQYIPEIPTTTRGDVSDITAPQGQGGDDGGGTGTGALAVTGTDSGTLAAKGLALAVAGLALIVVRRRYAARA